MGIIGAILGIIAVWGTTNGWAWVSIIVGIIVLILGILGWTVAASSMW
ncbi:MAG TPA: hypothetical protein VFK33_16890 [Bacillales bacterium]|nr:hypothetical protein [Bacillales bacterium]